MKINWPRLILTVGSCLAAGFVGSVFTAPAIPGWYAGLIKPVFNPPNWIFGPVWTLLYILMGVSLYLVMVKPGLEKDARRALHLFLVQLSLNILWSIIFFGLKNLLAAFLEIVVLLLAIILTWRQFREISKTAANLLLPYIAWVSFASILNLSIVILNWR